MRVVGGLTVEELTARLEASACVWLEQASSTLDVVHEMAAQGAPGGLVVLADEQVAGRGRQGRRWISLAGTGVLLGYLLRPDEAIAGGVMALRVGLAVVDALEDVGAPAQLKWPNDIVAVDKKLGGILCEARWRGSDVDWLAIGVGLNIHGPMPAELGSRAIALDQMVPEVTRLAVLERLVPRLHRLPHRTTLLEDEQRDFGRHDWLVGKRLTEPIAGVASGIEVDGALLVQTEEGMRRVMGGSVATG